MPGKGKAVQRDYTEEERDSLAEGAAGLGVKLEELTKQLGEKTFDIYLNDHAYWSNVPKRVWDYTMGGHQVIKKWLSYREGKLLGRLLTPDEAYYVREMARRIAALRITEAQLDINYSLVKTSTYAWSAHKPAQQPKVDVPEGEATKATEAPSTGTQ